MLYCPKSDYLIEFPSPATLKKRIMISTKPPEYRESQSGRSTSKRQQSNNESDQDEEYSGIKAVDDEVHKLLISSICVIIGK